MSKRKRVIRVVVPLLIVVAGFLVMRLLLLSRSAPQKEAPGTPGALVEVLAVAPRDHRVRVAATGTVQARRIAAITPRVSGRVTRVSPDFVAGGFFSEGDLLFEIEEVDYRLALERAKASLAQAELELELEESRARVARIEWEALAARDDDGPPDPLVLRDPQLKKARASVAAARAAVKEAELALQRTRLYAPFDCRVRSEGVEVGQYVRAGTSVAEVAGTTTAEVLVAVPVEELQWLSLPRAGHRRPGSPAEVVVAGGDRTFTWEGRVVRSLGEVDPKGRMARIVVAVDDPYHLRNSKAEDVPDLEMGMFVDVALYGKTLKRVFPLPRRALREGNTVWVVDGDDKLSIRPVTVVRREGDTVFVSDGLEPGDLVVLTSVTGAAEGMKLRPVVQGEVK